MKRIKVVSAIACLTITAMLCAASDAHAQYDLSAAVRLQVEPRQTEVFIDGYYAGTVDDFDGFFQRLRLEPGEHDIELYLAGHRSLRQKIYLQPGGTFKIRYTMVTVAPGDTPDPRPTPPAGGPPRRPVDAYGRPRGPSPSPERPESRSRERRGPAESAFGTLAIRVQPRDADVEIDGERWEGPATSERLLIQLPEGTHRVEIRKPGFESFSSTIQVRRGETATLNVSLSKE